MFERLEARVNVVAMKRLSNATARINGRDVRVIFDKRGVLSRVGNAGMMASAVQMEISDADIPTSFIGMQIEVDGVAWIVDDKVQDGVKEAGISTVTLEKP